MISQNERIENMNEFYTTLTSITVVIIICLAVGLLITFDPLARIVRGMQHLKRWRVTRQIRKVRRVIDRYTPSVILTENEKKSVVLDYLKENKMFCSNKERL